MSTSPKTALLEEYALVARALSAPARLSLLEQLAQGVIYRLTDARTLELMDLLRIVAERNLAHVEHILRGLSDGQDAPEPVTRDDLAARLAEGSVTVLDMRPADEYASGHIPGARNITLADLERILPTLEPAPRSSPIAAALIAFMPIRRSQRCASTG